MKSCNHMCSHSCNGSQEPFFNKTMLGLTRQGCHKTVSALLLFFLGLPDPQVCLQLSISGTASWASHEFERTRGKVTANYGRKCLKTSYRTCMSQCPIV
ncbi:uncharacterized protein TNCV_2088571 [Trichonephila clavipes]|nr:uncharacterized protein TNCV_2088571 [Trichonephila clavipes]